MNAAETILELTNQHLIRYGVLTVFALTLAFTLVFLNKKGAQWFLLMTGVWTVINIAIIVGLNFHIYQPASAEVPQILAHLNYWLQINIALDILYGVVALGLIWRAKYITTYKLMFQQYGLAVALQSVGLLLIDGFFLRQLADLYHQYSMVF